MSDTTAPTPGPAQARSGDPGAQGHAPPRRALQAGAPDRHRGGRLRRGLRRDLAGAPGPGDAARPAGGQELYNTERKPTPDGLAALPGDYGQMRTDTPQLGPPLPGDLGGPILERQRQLGIAPGASMAQSRDDAALAERQRLAQQARRRGKRACSSRSPPGLRRPPRRVAGQGAGVATAGELPPTADANRLNLDPERDQNNQQRKLDFLNQPVEKSIYNPHALQTPASPYQVMAGSIIAASLDHGPELGSAGSRRRPGDRERLRQRDRPDAADPAGRAADRQL